MFIITNTSHTHTLRKDRFGSFILDSDEYGSIPVAEFATEDDAERCIKSLKKSVRNQLTISEIKEEL